MMKIRELTTDERMRWGECPICHAKDGDLCDSSIESNGGVSIGWVGPIQEVVHLDRIRAAPFRVSEVPA